jgi:hypothetical protein
MDTSLRAYLFNDLMPFLEVAADQRADKKAEVNLIAVAAAR